MSEKCRGLKKKIFDKLHFCIYNVVVEFEWDEQKNLTNYAKHKVSFELAQLVFDDPRHLVKFDRVADGENRWHALGNVKGRHVLTVVHTYRGSEEEIIRIISARRASPNERRQYEQI